MRHKKQDVSPGAHKQTPPQRERETKNIQKQRTVFRDGKTHHWSNHKFPNKLKNTISEESIIFENGSTFKYSNHAYALLGAIIEKVSNQKYDDYMYESIINPLNLSSTYPDLPDEVPDDLGFGYERVIPGKLNREIFDHSKTYAYASATGFISNSADIAKFLSSLCLDTEYSVINSCLLYTSDAADE